MELSVYCSQRNYWRHLAPVVAELRARGHDVECWSQSGDAEWGPPLVIPHQLHRIRPLLLVASYADGHRFTNRVLIYLEHGAGQTYEVGSNRLRLGFAGGGGLEHVWLFLSPSERVADRWRAAYPHALVETVGSPALDRYHARTIASEQDPLAPGDRPSAPARPVVAFTCHWYFGGDDLPEGMPALPRFLDAIGELDREEFELIATAHPRVATRAARWWAALGIPFLLDPDEILDRADLLVADNTSLMYEAAAAGIPVLALNAPEYRRDVEHGLRFWSHVPGLQCDEPEVLEGLIRAALRDEGSGLPALRARAVAYAYDVLDGQAATRAADAISALEGAPMPPTPPQATPEVADRVEEVVGRLYQLGATDELVANFRELPAQDLERIRRMNDVRLRALVREALAAATTAAEIADELPPLPSEEELDDAALELLSADSIDDILDAVGDDDELAARLFRLEASGAARIDLLEGLAAVADIDYEAPEVETEEVSTATPGAPEGDTEEDEGEDLEDDDDLDDEDDEDLEDEDAEEIEAEDLGKAGEPAPPLE